MLIVNTKEFQLLKEHLGFKDLETNQPRLLFYGSSPVWSGMPIIISDYASDLASFTEEEKIEKYQITKLPLATLPWAIISVIALWIILR